jgi:hypothetical protein
MPVYSIPPIVYTAMIVGDGALFRMIHPGKDDAIPIFSKAEAVTPFMQHHGIINFEVGQVVDIKELFRKTYEKGWMVILDPVVKDDGTIEGIGFPHVMNYESATNTNN